MERRNWRLALLALLAATGNSALAGGESHVSVQDLAWSPDGQHLFFSALRVRSDWSDYAPEKWSVYRYDLAARELRRIVPSALYVAADPSALRLAVGRLVGSTRDLFVVDYDGRDVARLTSHPADDFAASWSPDGERLAFTSRRDGEPEIFLVDADGGDARRLTRSGGAKAYNPSWAPDGRRIAYYLERGDGRDQIHVVDVDGSGDVDVTRDERNNVFPTWIDAERIVYSAGGKDGPSRLFTVRADGSEKRPLLALEADFARFSPDGSRIAYVGREERILVVATDGRLLDRIPLTGVDGETSTPATTNPP